MKFKTDGRVYDGGQQPLLVILTERDLANIRGMAPHHRRYCVVPATWSIEQARAWMAAQGETGMEPCPET